MVQSPYRNTSFKPQSYDRKNPQLQAQYIPARITVTQTLTSTETPNYSTVLSVHIAGLKFKHHPLFSAEHIFEQKLISYYDTYKQKLSSNKFVRIGKHLQAIRNSKNVYSANGDHTTTTSLNKIKKLRTLYFEEGKQLRLLLKTILETWKTIKRIRQKSGYSNTDIKLIIRKEKCDYEEEKLKREQEINETYNEVILERCEEEPNNDQIMEAPRITNRDKIFQSVEEMFRECFKAPGEPILHLCISYDNKITETTTDEKENLRRKAVVATKLYLKLFCNQLQVCRSKTIQLTDKFTCLFEETFSMQAFSKPKNIVVEVYEKNSFMLKRKICEANIQVDAKHAKCMLQEIQFEKDELVHYTHEGVGSGNEVNKILKQYGCANEIINTSGVINYEIFWENYEANSRDTHTSIVNDNGELDPQKLMIWANENKPDPQDPRNYVLYECINNYKDGTADTPKHTSKYFRINPGLHELYRSHKEIEENLRFQLLTLRDGNEPEFVGMIIPNRLNEIPATILDDYKTRTHEEHNLIENTDNSENEIDRKRSLGRKYLKQIYTKVFHQCRSNQRSLMYEDVVNEKLIPHIERFIKNILTSLINWMQRQPTFNILRYSVPLKPLKHYTETTFNTPAKITVIVKSALNIPNRYISTSQYKAPKTFVAVTYKKAQVRTSTVEGTNPIWNEELILPLESKNVDYLSPNCFNGSVAIQLFDEITSNTPTGKMNAQNWLGTVNVPISSFLNNKMEGLFKCTKPNHILGYEHGINSTNSTRNITAEPICLSLNISFHPTIPKLTQDMEELESNELQFIKQYIIQWNETYNNEYPDRKFNALSIDMYGKTTCVTRYIKALEPPKLYPDGFDVSAEQCMRYVSMIPFTDSNKFYENVWLSSEQLLKLMIGSITDHAIMLVCYLTSLDIESWLLLGYGFPQGSTAYVLTREYTKDVNNPNPKHYIYDVVTAQKYGLFDAYCPLHRIYCTINEHNVWANRQRTNQINLTRFDFTTSSDWWPLFNNQITAPTNSYQQKIIYYTTPNVQELEVRIEKKVRNKISKVRKYERTIWNQQISKTLKNIITKCEIGLTSRRRNSELLVNLQNISLSNVVNGFIVSMPYTTISSILSVVYSSGINLHQDRNTEFASAVHLLHYPNHVLTVWISVVAVAPLYDPAFSQDLRI